MAPGKHATPVYPGSAFVHTQRYKAPSGMELSQLGMMPGQPKPSATADSTVTELQPKLSICRPTILKTPWQISTLREEFRRRRTLRPASFSWLQYVALIVLSSGSRAHSQLSAVPATRRYGSVAPHLAKVTLQNSDSPDHLCGHPNRIRRPAHPSRQAGSKRGNAQ